MFCAFILLPIFSTVLKEAEPVLKAIRQKLHALTLDRTPPKQKLHTKKPIDKPQDRSISNPSTEDQGAKAGKPYYIVQVGEVANLYKTTKGSSVQKQSTRLLDLHGLTRKEAVSKLDENLAKWVKTAMKGSYPFVIPVALVCGGGNQVLSEIVVEWIKSKDNVRNAPKNYFG